MSMADELAKLDHLRRSGALSDAEFEMAKRSLLHQGTMPVRNDSLGRAANRYVNFQVVAAVIGLIMFLIFLFGIILPGMNGMTHPAPPSLPGYNQAPINFP
jgi:hypothetical protein